MSVFNSKNFNAEVFGKYLETVPRVKQNAFLSAGILRARTDLKQMLVDQVGGNFISIPMTGRIGGDSINYDGSNNITATGIDTYLQSMIVQGKAKAWSEKDFSFDITGKDFMAEIAKQVAGYWDDEDQASIISVLKGVFGMTTTNGAKFVSEHTYDITSADESVVGASTLNSAIQKAAGANKNIFTLAIMHSAVATNLENLQLLTYAKGTDANGMQRDMTMATWNGRTVLIDDNVPTSQTEGGDTIYTTYVLGANALDYCDCGAKVPNEVARDPYTNGGVDTLITRQRKLWAPKGISFVQPSSPVISPTDAQLATGTFWDIVKSTDGTTPYDLKAIPIAQIKSLG